MNPFDALGLPAGPQLADEQVRSAWRDVAAATHPDRADGGDPAAYAAAAAAYAQLRTPWGRSEALADIPSASQEAGPYGGLGAVARPAADRLPVRGLPARVRHGRPGRLAARTLAAIAVAVLAVTVCGGTPSAPAIITGCALWWARTARGDLAPPPGR